MILIWFQLRFWYGFSCDSWCFETNPSEPYPKLWVFGFTMNMGQTTYLFVDGRVAMAVSIPFLSWHFGLKTRSKDPRATTRKDRRCPKALKKTPWCQNTRKKHLGNISGCISAPETTFFPLRRGHVDLITKSFWQHFNIAPETRRFLCLPVVVSS